MPNYSGVAIPDYAKGGGSAVLPFSKNKQIDAGEILVWFKVISNDPEQIRQTARVIQEQVAGQRVGTKGISVIISDDSVELSATKMSELCAKIAPHVAATLGIKVPVG